MLGGAATHFALAASFFDEVRVVGPVGDDFAEADMDGPAHARHHHRRRRARDGRQTFFWSGEYHDNLNQRETHETELNVFDDFEPEALAARARGCDVLFLANIQPELQLDVREQCPAARFVAMDSMNLWINIARDPLERDDPLGRLPDPQRRGARAAHGRAEHARRRARAAELGAQGRRGQARQVRRGAVHAGGLLRAARLPGHRRRRPDRRGRHLRRRLRRLRRGRSATSRSTTTCSRARWPTARALASFNVEAFGTERVVAVAADEVSQRVADLQRMTAFEPRPLALRG